jgi:hypothetical protein
MAKKRNTVQEKAKISADHYYFKQPEPFQSCLLALKTIILAHDPQITHGRMFQIPFFFYRDKKLAFLWIHRKKLLLGFVEDMKIQKAVPGTRRKNKYETLVIDPEADIPVKAIAKKLDALMRKYDRLEK